MKKHIFLLLLLTLNLNLFSQEITEKERDFYVKILYKTDSIRINKTTHIVYKYEEFKTSNFFNEIISPTDITDCTKLVQQTAKLNLNGEKQLVLTGKLTERFNTQINGVFSINLSENNLSTTNGEKFKLYDIYNSRTGYGNVDFKIDVKSELSINEKISGSVTFKLNYLIGYDKIELTINDIGKNIILNNCKYHISNIVKNMIILEKYCAESTEIKVINFDKKGNVAKPYPYMELMEMIEKDSTISDESFDSKKRETYKMVWDLFDKRPNISYKEFEEIFTVEKLLQMKKDGKYLIIENIAPFENKFVLYSPIFQSEIITVKM